MYFPEPVTPIRFWAALWLLIFGTVASLSCCCRLGRGVVRRSLRRPRGRLAPGRSVALPAAGRRGGRLGPFGFLGWFRRRWFRLGLWLRGLRRFLRRGFRLRLGL